MPPRRCGVTGRGWASRALFGSAAAWSCGLRPQDTEHLTSLEWGLGLDWWLRHQLQGLSRPFELVNVEAGVQGLESASGCGAGTRRSVGSQYETGHLTLGSEAGLACLTVHFMGQGCSSHSWRQHRPFSACPWPFSSSLLSLVFFSLGSGLNSL